MDLPNERKLHDERLREAWVRCPDCNTVLVPTGDAYAPVDAADNPRSWTIAFRCPNHDDEIIRIWGPNLQPLLDEVLRGVDVSELPIVGPNLRELT